MTGGGTGGHITPILAVAYELKQAAPDCTVVFVGERGGKFAELTDNNKAIDQTFAVSSGKFRRYYGESWLRRLTDIRTILLNIRDIYRVCRGTWQAWRLLGRVRPDVILLKGGFVGVPVGLAAALRHIPTVTHDSDALPGLANRIAGRWAVVHATALPAAYYPYKAAKVQPVGVLVEHTYQPVNEAAERRYKQQLGLDPDNPLLLVTGGSSGAERINKTVAGFVDELLQKLPALHIIHQVGKGKARVYKEYQHDRLQVVEFLRPLSVAMGAADVVITRASGNTLAELGVQGKACIVIPNPYLTEGHQLKNAERLKEQGAAIVLEEKQLYDAQHGLFALTLQLLSDPNQRSELAAKLQAITIPDAAKRLALLLLGQTKA